jgi:hypothetical protein
MFGIELHPTGIGLLCAAAAAASGAPLFSDGLRALRLRREFARLRDADLGQAFDGFGEVHGRVALESPLFAPLSGRPCAGFRLEIRVAGSRTMSVVEENRSFQLASGNRTARVVTEGARWELPVSAERDFTPADVPSDRVTSLISQVPEMASARNAGATLHLVERALVSGSICHVIGMVHQGQVVAIERKPAARLRTGTDDLPVDLDRARPDLFEVHAEPDLSIDRGGQLDFLLVSDRRPEPTRFAPPLWRIAGVMLGPALSLAGLIYLAGALDLLRASGGH